MKVIVGLGNSGEEYKLTRHNLGYLVVDKIAEIRNSPRAARLPDGQGRAGKFEIRKRFSAEVAAEEIEGEKIVLVKPLTYMNKSGETVRKVVDCYLTPGDLFHKTPGVLRGRETRGVGESLFVVHDELDLPLGKLKIQKDVSAAGHHGVESIIENLGTQDFVRFRLGVNSLKRRLLSNSKGVSLKDWEDYLLADFTKKELEIIDPAIEQTAEAILYAIENGVERAMNKYN